MSMTNPRIATTMPRREKEPDASLTSLEQRMLGLIQTGYPLEARPYEVLSRTLDIGHDEALDCVRGLYEKGCIKRLGAVFDSSALGYVSTLCALAVDDPDDVERCAAIISSYPEVTHNYERVDRYNIWFTLIACSHERIERILAQIKEATGYADLLDLPASKLYKIRVDFKFAAQGAPSGIAQSSEYMPDRAAADNRARAGRVGKAIPLDERDRALVRVLQENLAVCPHPFAQVARACASQGFELSEADVLERVRAWSASGLIRRFGAVVSHRRLGFAFNAMTVFDVPDDQADAAGAIMAADSHVSHCYLRPRFPSWPANLYAMVHGHTEDECDACIARISQTMEDEGIVCSVPRRLYSTREFKKCSMRYFMEEE